MHRIYVCKNDKRLVCYEPQPVDKQIRKKAKNKV